VSIKQEKSILPKIFRPGQDREDMIVQIIIYASGQEYTCNGA
jgi:hypothetical protein